MEYKQVEQKYVEGALKIAMVEYEKECETCPQLIKHDFSKELREQLCYLFKQKYGKVAIEDEVVVGYLTFIGPWDGFHGLAKGVFSPLGGSAFIGDNRAKMASKLFTEVAADMVRDGISSVALSRYAHDEEVGNSFVLNGFGIRCSDAIMELKIRNNNAVKNSNIQYKELPKDEKRKLNDLRKGLIEHLYQAPIFLPTDLSNFKSWLENDEIRVFVAVDKDEIIGFMSICDEAENFITNSNDITNICGAYVKEEYRGSGVARELLEHVCCVCEQEGKNYLGVDYETMNPTALHFWGKYFDNYTFSYVRRIDERAIEYDIYLEKEWGNFMERKKK